MCVTALLAQAIFGVAAHIVSSYMPAAYGTPAQAALAEARTHTPQVLAQMGHMNARPIADTSPTYPLKASPNHRYLVDQNNRPFLMVGDSPQSLMTNLSPAEAKTYMANRRAYGVNALWINMLCNWPSVCNADGTTFDGIAPFTVAGDLSTPNAAYFQRVDGMIAIAEANGMVVLLDPIETTGWLDILRANGTAKAFHYGQFLGSRYKKFPNVIWMHGNDFQSWQNAMDRALVQAVALGIRSVDTTNIHTVELNFFTSGSLQDPTWAPIIELDAAYTYFPTYAQVLTEYNRPNFKPVFMVEANYEFEHNAGTDGGSVQNLRRQEYWTMLSGAAGQLYGSAHTWQLQKGWESNLDTPGTFQLSYMKDLFASKKWYDLVPDQDHTVVTSGYGSLSCLAGNSAARAAGDTDSYVARTLLWILRHLSVGSIPTNSCATTAQTPDGSLTIAYMPTIRTITVDMSKLPGMATASWYDPTNGKYTPIDGSPFPNKGSRKFAAPGNNGLGDGDWVLVLEASTR
jgi:hypothetical protein